MGLMVLKKDKRKIIVKSLIVLTLMLNVNYILAQRLYVDGGLGMAFQAFPTKVETFFNVNNDNNTVRLQQPAFSLGSGFLMGGSIGFFFNDYIGIDFGLQYQVGSKIEFSQEYVILTQTELKEKKLYGNRFSIIPSLIVKAGDGKINPFFKAGPMFGFVSQFMDEKTTIDTNISVKFWDYSGPMAIGLKMDVGAQYNISENFLIYISSSFSNMIYKPSQAEVYHSARNGNNQSLQPFEKSILFVDWSDDPYNAGPQDPEKPTRMQSQSFSYSNISLQMGVRYLF